MSKNGQAYFKNLEALATRFLKCVWHFEKLCIKELSVNYCKYQVYHVIKNFSIIAENFAYFLKYLFFLGVIKLGNDNLVWVAYLE